MITYSAHNNEVSNEVPFLKDSVFLYFGDLDKENVDIINEYIRSQLKSNFIIEDRINDSDSLDTGSIPVRGTNLITVLLWLHFLKKEIN